MPEERTPPDLEELVQRLLGATNARDIDALMCLYRPNAVWDASPMGIGVFEDPEAIRGFFEDWLSSYEDFEQVLEEMRDLGNGMSFGVFLQRARPRGSSGFVELHWGAVAIVSDSLFERTTAYSDIDQARAAAEPLAQERG